MFNLSLSGHSSGAGGEEEGGGNAGDLHDGQMLM